ncbi:MAG: GTP-binding protein, partial [bacterium]|nr:GTP-binding protein [bacterium]
MTKVDVISGFLGAGKTTLIRKLLKDGLQDEQVVLIENEFGEIGIDGGFLKEAGIEIKEMNSGCICCSLVGDFGKSLLEVINTYHPARILIEPSGVGKLSDVLKAIENVAEEAGIVINSASVVVDAKKCKVYMKNFGEFFENQVEYARAIILSRTQDVNEDKLQECEALIREHNTEAHIVTTPWEDLSGAQILDAMEHTTDFVKELEHEMHEHHHHDHEEHDESCTCGCHDHDHEHHHDHEEHDENCTCGCHDH